MTAEPAPAVDGGPLSRLLAGEPAVVTAGIAVLEEALVAQGVTTIPVAWRPPPTAAADALARLAFDPRVERANAEAVARFSAAHPMLVDVQSAATVLGLERGQLLHAGPPIDWASASGPLRGAIIGALLYEGWADDAETAEGLAASGEVTWEPCHHRGAVGPMAGIVSPSMPVWVLDDVATGRRSACTLNEGLGKVLRYGAFEPAVVERLRWMEAVLGPALGAALRAHGPLDVRAMLATMLAMGDEGHNRNRAGTGILIRELAPHLVRTGGASDDVADVLAFMHSNDHFALNVVMPACKLAAEAAADIPGSTVVTTMARNGTDFGIRVSGTGDRWFTGPAGTPHGLFFPGFGPDDANPDIGDSAITETAGMGGFAMAASPSIVQFVGGEVADAFATTARMREITLAEHPTSTIPGLGFQGIAIGIDVRLVLRSGVLPTINTGMAGKVAGTGQVGAGLVEPPVECFVRAAQALADLVP
jgi:hypothetical protein